MRSPERPGGRRAARLLGLGGLVAFAAAALTPLPNHLASWLAGPIRLEPADAIVVLARGGVNADGTLTEPSARRLLWGILLYQRGLAPLLVLSGTRDARGLDEAAARADLARGLGLPPDALVTESGGNTTREEADRMRTRLGPLGVRRILLVSDWSDVARARAMFNRAGFTVLPAPTSTAGTASPEARLGLARDLLIESLAWSYYRLTGAI
jgi:uncharacterized SAM-binding protein YcdF (DUF218 family)